MTELYTVQQVTKLLQVNRITVYRMLQDGRLKGVRVGSQWRFPASEIARLTGQPALPGSETPETPAGLPVHCLQTIQDLFSSIGQLPAVMVDMEGQPLTRISQPCAFCSAIGSTEAGWNACRASWRELAQSCGTFTRVATCHAGLNYLAAPLNDAGGQIGAFVVGQFYLQAAEKAEEAGRARELAARYGLAAPLLESEVARVPVLSVEQQGKVVGWPQQAARAANSILSERTGFIARLQQIADLTQIP